MSGSPGGRPKRAKAGKPAEKFSPGGPRKGRARILSEGDADDLTKRAGSLERRVGFLEGRVGTLEDRLGVLGEELRSKKVEDEQGVKMAELGARLVRMEKAKEQESSGGQEEKGREMERELRSLRAAVGETGGEIGEAWRVRNGMEEVLGQMRKGRGWPARMGGWPRRKVRRYVGWRIGWLGRLSC